VIKDIRVFSRYSTEKLISTEATWGLKNPWILISIYSGPKGPVIKTEFDFEVLCVKGCVDCEAFEFHDITMENYVRFKKVYRMEHNRYKVFARGQARKIVSYIKRYHKDERDLTLVVHCEAGVSRSGAVGLFACRLFGLDECRFRARHPAIDPNPHVFDTLCSVAKKDLGSVEDVF
jgi:hypothetical protein